MTSQICPPWCTIHDDPAWTGAHHGDPIDIAAVIEHDGIAEPVAVVPTRTETDAGRWIEAQAEETRLLSVRLDLSSATRLARAIDIVTGSAVCTS